MSAAASPGRLRSHAVKTVAAACVCAVAAGPWLLGSSSDASTPAASPGQVAGTHCREQALRYGNTDAGTIRAEQDRFERDPHAAPVPEPGTYDAPLDPTGSLHAVLHGTVVVYRRADVGAGATQGLGALVRRAQEVQVPVLVAPRRQDAALVAVRQGAQLTCTAATRADVAAVRAFAAKQFPVIRQTGA